MSRRWIRGAMVLVAALALVACGGDDGNGDGGAGSPEPADGGTSADITISGFAFDPSSLDVEAGATITVVNDDSTTHTFTADDGSFDEELGQGASAEVTVDGESGDQIPYHCRIHSSMTGTLTIA